MAAAEEDKRDRKEFSMFHLDDGLIILEDGKRMPSEIYANETITTEIDRLESENQQLEDMVRSLQTTIAKVSEELEAKFKKYDELNSRKKEHPIVVDFNAAIKQSTKMEKAATAGKKQMELDENKHGQELTRLKAKCDGSEGSSKLKRIAKRGPSKKCPWK